MVHGEGRPADPMTDSFIDVNTQGGTNTDPMSQSFVFDSSMSSGAVSGLLLCKANHLVTLASSVGLEEMIGNIVLFVRSNET